MHAMTNVRAATGNASREALLSGDGGWDGRARSFGGSSPFFFVRQATSSRSDLRSSKRRLGILESSRRRRGKEKSQEICGWVSACGRLAVGCIGWLPPSLSFLLTSASSSVGVGTEDRDDALEI